MEGQISVLLAAMDKVAVEGTVMVTTVDELQEPVVPVRV